MSNIVEMNPFGKENAEMEQRIEAAIKSVHEAHSKFDREFGDGSSTEVDTVWVYGVLHHLMDIGGGRDWDAFVFEALQEVVNKGLGQIYERTK
jgi:hypothetical protein